MYKRSITPSPVPSRENGVPTSATSRLNIPDSPEKSDLTTKPKSSAGSSRSNRTQSPITYRNEERESTASGTRSPETTDQIAETEPTSDSNQSPSPREYVEESPERSTYDEEEMKSRGLERIIEEDHETVSSTSHRSQGTAETTDVADVVRYPQEMYDQRRHIVPSQRSVINTQPHNERSYQIYPNLQNENKPYIDSPIPSMSDSDIPAELEALIPINSLFIHKDESRRRTVYEVRLIDGPMVYSTIDTEGPLLSCCSCCSRGAPSYARFLFDTFGPVIQMQDERKGCWTHRSTEVFSPPYSYIGHLYNTSNFMKFRVLITDGEDEPVYRVRPTVIRTCCTGQNYSIISQRDNVKVGSIYRRRDFGWRTAYTVHFNIELPVKHKALIVSTIFFLDDILGETDRGGLGI